MARYEARAELALLCSDSYRATLDGPLCAGLGRLVESSGETIRQVFPNYMTGAVSASLAEWRERTGDEGQAAVAIRVELQEKFEEYAPAISDLKEAIRTAQGPINEWVLPSGFTYVGAGNFARAFRFNDEATGEQLVAKTPSESGSTSKALEIENRACALIPALGGAAFGLEQLRAMSYEGWAISRYAPGGAIEGIPLSQVDSLLDEARLDKSLDSLDEIDQRRISLDWLGEGNMLLDATSSDTPFWYLDFMRVRGVRDLSDRNFGGLITTFRHAGTTVVTKAADRREIINPKLLYLVDKYESRHPDRADTVQTIRERILA